jgi:hypothetical protein
VCLWWSWVREKSCRAIHSGGRSESRVFGVCSVSEQRSANWLTLARGVSYDGAAGALVIRVDIVAATAMVASIEGCTGELL